MPVTTTASRLDEAEDPNRFPAGHFDVISTHHVLEHLRNPAETMERLARWLKPDGILYAAVPNMAATGKPPHERFHFAHVHGYVRETFDLLGAAPVCAAHRVLARGHHGGLPQDRRARRTAEESRPRRPARGRSEADVGGALLRLRRLDLAALRRNAKAVRDGMAKDGMAKDGNAKR